MIVYKVTSPSGKVYVGVTNRSLEARWSSHCRDKRLRKLKTSIDKYGKDRFRLEILCEVDSIEEAYDLEKLYIKEFDCLLNGYNMTEGGEGTHGRKASTITKNKMSASRIGVPLSESHKDAISQSSKGFSNRQLKWKVKHPCGKIEVVNNRKDFCRSYGLNYGSVMTYTSWGKPYRGYLFEKVKK